LFFCNSDPLTFGGEVALLIEGRDEIFDVREVALVATDIERFSSDVVGEPFEDGGGDD